jgi:hypothetical protein
MQLAELILPTIATLALGTALLVPLRDDRPGKRATFCGKALTAYADFRSGDEVIARGPGSDSALLIDDDACDAASREAQREPDGNPEPKTRPPSAVQAIIARLRRFFEVNPAHDARAADFSFPSQPQNVERSFADELSTLLPVASPADPRPDESLRQYDPRDGEIPDWEAQREQVLITTPLPGSFERAVPLTRMPLRPQTLDITWPSMIPAGDLLESRERRHAFLACDHENDPALEPVFVAAYRQEDGRGRLLALRAICRGGLPIAYDLLVNALALGTDEERSYAVDALIAMNRLDAVIDAFSDRVDAIAAQAALGYVRSLHREEYITALEPYIDRARIESILALLGGIVE